MFKFTRQPIQEKTETKLPIKPNWKFLAIVVVFAILAVGGILLWQQSEQTEQITNEWPPEDVVQLPGSETWAYINRLTILGSGQDVETIVVELGGKIVYTVPETDTYEAQFPVSSLSELDRVKNGLNERRIQAVYSYVMPPPWQPTSQKQPTSNNQQSTVNTSTWQTYRNEEFGFELKYPDNWRLELEGVYNGFELRISQEEYINISNVPIKTGQEMFDVVIANTRIYDSSNSPKDWVECGSGGPCPPPPSKDEVSIRNFGGNSFYHVFNYLFEGQYGVVYYIKNPGNNTAVRFLLKGFTRSRNWTDADYNADEEPNHSALKQILSTFRFVEAGIDK